MNLRLGRGRALRGIERDLAHADPDLNVLFLSFARLTRGKKMPAAEKIRIRPLRGIRVAGTAGGPSPDA